MKSGPGKQNDHVDTEATARSFDTLTTLILEGHALARMGEEVTRRSEAMLTAAEALAKQHGVSVEDVLSSILSKH